MKSSKTMIEEYVDASDWRVKENSTVQYSIGGLILSNSGNVSSDYWLSEIYDEEIANAHRNADIHIHDLSMLTGYCFTGDTRVKTLDGQNPTFKELVESGAQEFWVYSYDVENGRVVPALATSPRITRVTDSLVEITLADKTTIKCTPDHPFLLRDGQYIEAQNLKPNMSLMSLCVGENFATEFQYNAHRDSEKANYNHSVRAVRVLNLAAPVEVYDLTVPDYHNFAIEGNVFVHNCAGWSLKQLIQEGLGGVPGKIASSPARHLSTLCNQMVNFLGIMQNEWAG